MAQSEEYTCGPLTIVKFIDALFRLSCGDNVKFTGVWAIQRIIDQKWNTLGKSIPFTISFDAEDKNDILDTSWDNELKTDAPKPSWENSWIPEGEDGKVLVTDKDCVDYVNNTLLGSWIDLAANKDLTKGVSSEDLWGKNCP